MKKEVIKENDGCVVLSSEAVDGKYYGYVDSDSDSEDNNGFITRERWDRGRYICRACRGLTYANSHMAPGGYSSLKATIDALLDTGFQVFQFDTHQELMTWLASVK